MRTGDLIRPQEGSIMQNDRVRYVRSRISRSGFSGERVFRVTQDDGSEHVSVAPTHYFQTEAGELLGADMPAKGKPMRGWIEGMLIADDGEKLTIALPDGNTIKVHPDQVQTPTSRPYVPIGS
jgi:hypothetical protein